jgi:hypothetical protein
VDDKLYPVLFTQSKEQSQLRYGELSLLHVIYFSYLEPVKVMTNNIVKALLPKVKDAHGYINFDQFFKGSEEAAPSVKKCKNVAVDQSDAKIRRIARVGKILPKAVARNWAKSSAVCSRRTSSRAIAG